MIRSEQIDTLAAALSKAQGEFEAVDKSANNPFFKSRFAPLPDVVKAAAPILSKHGLAVWQGPATQTEAPGMSGEVLWTVVLHSSGQYIGSAMSLRPVKGDPQAQGSAITYARRYAYMAALGLVADEDDDGNHASGRSKPASRQQNPGRGNGQPDAPKAASEPHSTPRGDEQPATEITLGELTKAFKASGKSAEELRTILSEVGVPPNMGTKDLTEDQATWVVIKLASGEAS